MTLSQRSGFLILILLIVAIEFIIQFWPFQKDAKPPTFTAKELAIAERIEVEEEDFSDASKPVQYFNFNPNALDEKGYEKLGFSSKQAKSIIKYRYIKGGNFKSIEEFGESYVISDKKLEALRPYIQLKPVHGNNKYNTYNNQKTYNNYKSNQKLSSFQLNQQNKADFVQLGFSEKQAQTILNFKNSLPNQRFESKEQFRQCYAVNNYMFNKLEPYIVLSEKARANKLQVQNGTQKLDVNKASEKELIALGVDQQTASDIIKYRDFNNGFKDFKSVEDCPCISSENFNLIKNHIVIQ